MQEELKVRCNKRNTKWCNEFQYYHNVKCIHYDEHDEIHGCKDKSILCNGHKVMCKKV